MATESKTAPAAGMPKIRSYEDFSVQFGGPEISRNDYKDSTFHTGVQEDGDAMFRNKVDLMEAPAGQLMEDVGMLETAGDKQEEAENKKITGTR